MSWALNQGPSFNSQLGATHKINGFFQRFELTQDDPRMTPGKRIVKPKRDTSVKGKLGKQIKYSDAIPKDQPNPIYTGFGNVKNDITNKIRKKKRGGLKKRRLK